jgi:pimeloyl-ACP methyl ester carboxylesterase
MPEACNTAWRPGRVRCLHPGGFHDIAYVEWGDPCARDVLVCVHGLTRQGRDFDRLAQALSSRYRVICPDMAGRGRSDWLDHPQHYALAQYVSDMATVIARLNVEQLDWLGTSMGGLIGMMLAALPHSPIRRLILNDIGPVIAPSALRRIGAYVAKVPIFAHRDELLPYFRRVYAAFGLTDAQLEELIAHSCRALPQGQWTLHYDPRIAQAFRPRWKDVLHFGRTQTLWPVYDAITCPTLALRGARSDLLDSATHQAMGQRGPHAQGIEIPDVGHAPMFFDATQIGIVADWLATTPPRSGSPA